MTTSFTALVLAFLLILFGTTNRPFRFYLIWKEDLIYSGIEPEPFAWQSSALQARHIDIYKIYYPNEYYLFLVSCNLLNRNDVKTYYLQFCMLLTYNWWLFSIKLLTIPTELSELVIKGTELFTLLITKVLNFCKILAIT